MYNANHMKALSDRHRELEDEIQKEERSPSVDQMKVSELKRQKLRLKEEIERQSREGQEAA